MVFEDSSPQKESELDLWSRFQKQMFIINLKINLVAEPKKSKSVILDIFKR